MNFSVSNWFLCYVLLKYIGYVLIKWKMLCFSVNFYNVCYIVDVFIVLNIEIKIWGRRGLVSNVNCY